MWQSLHLLLLLGYLVASQQLQNEKVGNPAPIRTGCQQLRRQLERQPLGDRYVPECGPRGEFLPVQCNGLQESCWCVDGRGFELAGTRARSINLVNCTRPKRCASFLCRMLCPYGFELDAQGCPLCECRNPCKRVACPAGLSCQLEEVPCADEPCPPLPTCKRPRSLDGQCPLGEPIISPDTRNPLLCGMHPSKPGCPTNYVCNVLRGNDYGVCCPLFDKAGQCPRANASSEAELQCPSTSSCESDRDCLGTEKCCDAAGCDYKACTKPVDASLCEQHRAVVKLLVGSNPDYAAYVPQCTEGGAFYVKQCTANGKLCWCVDQKGTQLKGTLGPADAISCQQTDVEARTQVELSSVCPEVSCATDCTMGYKSDKDGCKTCECSDPCKEIQCPSNAECMVLTCSSENCPPVATCMRQNTKPAVGETSCPEAGEVKPSVCPNETCTDDDQCSEGHACCPSLDCGSICFFISKPVRLPTMCEYLREVSVNMGNESLAIHVPSCRADGTYETVQCDGAPCWCVDEFGSEIPTTRVANGDRVDCNRARSLKTCDGLLCRLGCDYGFELDPDGCPVCECRNPCKNSGSRCDSGRCEMVSPQDCRGGWCPPVPTCIANAEEDPSPCAVGRPMIYEKDNVPVICDPGSAYQQCPVTHVCVSEGGSREGVCCPRPGLPLTVCENGVEPLSNVSCGPQKEEEQCPSTHFCLTNPLLGGTAPGVCCLKPKEVCGQVVEVGTCRSSQPRWFFNREHNACEPFVYGGCRGNYNNFQTEADCQLICPVETSACEKTRSRNLKIRKNYGNKMVFLPKCNKKTGGWDAIQCLEAVGLCWCVDSNGAQVSGSVVRGTPSCISHRSARQFKETPICPNGEAVHMCPEDLCDFATCVASPEASCRIDPCGSCTPVFYDSDNRPVDCNGGLTACLAEMDRVLHATSLPERHRRRRTRSVQEEEEESFILEETRQLAALSSMRPGAREVRSGIAIFIGPHLGSMLGSIGTEQMLIKPGVCPPPSFFTMLRSLNWRCRHRCVLDSQCQGSQKCCLGSCGLECSDPVGLTFRPALMSAMPPNCSTENGGYAVVQKQEELAWCVDKYGQPYHQTLTRGSVRCLRNGTIIERKESGPVCADDNMSPLVCRNECLESSCLQHPESVCVADPCNGCTTKWIDSDGLEVDCQDKCLQPVKTGSCDGHQPHYAFDGVECRTFDYSGCGGNDNNFATMQECRTECMEPRSICQQLRPTVDGPCKTSRLPNRARWFYDRNSRRCEEFAYGGCGGSDNHFATLEQCQATCPDVVYCPWAAVDEEMTGCSRLEACRNMTCEGGRELVCTIEPCTCRPVFVDERGKVIDCRSRPHLVMPELTSMTRCQHAGLDDTTHHSPPACADDGAFLSKQCNGDGHCWCVDEAGTQLTNAPDSENCRFVWVKSVEVSVNLKKVGGEEPDDSPLVASETKGLTNELLRRLSVAPPKDLVVERKSEDLQVTFALLGDNKVEAAFKLEQMVKSGGLKLMLTSGSLMADYKSSHFYYVAASNEYHLPNSIPDSLTSGALGETDSTMIVAVAMVGTLLLLLLIMVALMLHRRSGGQETTRSSLVTLMFNSPLYDLIAGKSQKAADPCEVKKSPVATVESEYESIQNEMNSAKLTPDVEDAQKSKDESNA